MTNSRKARIRRQRQRRALLTMALVLVTAFACIGGTIAWLTDNTDPVVNTFTVGNINIDLNETTKDYKMVPGNDIAKDPKVTVKANSEASWVFVKIEESDNLDSFISYAIDAGWTTLESQSNDKVTVIYREQAATTADVTYSILAGDEVTVLNTVTKDMMDAITTNPTLTFTAYAIQKDNVTSASDAWEKLNPTNP